MTTEGHGHTTGGFSPTYHSWACMMQRCTNPKRQYWAHYGGRGIKVCDRWRSFDAFLADMGERPPGTTLDREDNDRDYTPENCRWADASTQARNSSQVVRVTLRGETRTLPDWCEKLSRSINTVRCRVKRYGMSYEEALTRPLQSMPGVPVAKKGE